MTTTQIPRDQIELSGNGFTVRHARIEDLPGAQAVVRRVLQEDLGIGHTPMWHWDVDHPQKVYLDNPRHALFVAVDDATTEVIGTAGIQTGGPRSPIFESSLTDRYRFQETAQLYRVYISPEHRRRGVASTLVEAARRFVATEGGTGTCTCTLTRRAPVPSHSGGRSPD